nr:transketolase [Actinomycetales bacterium]
MSQACSAAELLATCYGGAVNLGPVAAPVVPPPFDRVPAPGAELVTGAVVHGEPAADRDRFIVSPAHYALVVYAALIEARRLDEVAMDNFNQDGSTVELIGAEHSPGFETTTGSLSQAISQAGGIALGRRLKGETGRTWVFMSDGEFQEGQTWEAFQALAFHGLDSVRVIVDVNLAQCDGPMDQVMTIEPLADRLRAFGASVDAVDGHDIGALIEAMGREADPGRPHVVLAYTDPVRGLPLLEERRPVLHYLRFTSEAEREKYAEAYEELVGKDA